MTKGGIPSTFIDEVRAKNDIIDIASKYMSLTRRGGGFWACCPFHSEKTPSFSIKQDGQFYKCFGCGESGNVITMVMKMENVDFLTAVEILAKNVGLEMPTDTESDEMRQRKIQRDKAYAILKETTEFYHKNLLNNPESEQAMYLKRRGISKEMIEKFKIGISLNYDALPKHLMQLKFKPEDMISAGVIGKNERGGLYDFYGTRLLFPIANGFGDVVAYSGRAVGDNIERTKYKNTPQTCVFNKSEILFAYNFVRDLKKERMLDEIIIVEGHIDVIMCHQAGFTNTIGCMGTALTTQHARKIKNLVDNVILCLDGDNAGVNATYKAIDTLKEVGLNVKVVRISGAKDPDEYLKKFGTESFRELLMDAKDCVDFVLQDSAKKYNLEVNAEKSKYITEALNYISKFSSTAEQEIYLSQVQKLVKIPIDALRKSLHAKEEKPQQKEIVEELNENISNRFIIDSKIMLLSSLLYKKISNLDEISGLFTSNDELSKLYRFLVQKIEANADYNVSTLFDNFEISNNSLIDQVINYVFPSEDVYDQYLRETIKRVKLYELKQEKEALTKMMNESTTIEGRFAYLAKIQEIDEKIRKEK
ncbi:MAG: DNA primase [Clostridia bacterium]|nr:DNA primase [Clostridia bacterium]